MVFRKSAKPNYSTCTYMYLSAMYTLHVSSLEVDTLYISIWGVHIKRSKRLIKGPAVLWNPQTCLALKPHLQLRISMMLIFGHIIQVPSPFFLKQIIQSLVLKYATTGVKSPVALEELQFINMKTGMSGLTGLQHVLSDHPRKSIFGPLCFVSSSLAMNYPTNCTKLHYLHLKACVKQPRTKNSPLHGP
jgi:hypothetical protein